MKRLLLIFLIFQMIGCQSKHDKLMEKLDKEELKLSLLKTEHISKLDSLRNNPALSSDSVFMYRSFYLKNQLEEQNRHIKDLKEQILLEK